MVFIMEVRNPCFCCTQPSNPTPRMDLDNALNELGMLSSVTDSRQQYLQEKDRSERIVRSRDRNLSEPGLSANPTPSNSPSKGSYQILTMNPQYVVSLSTAEPLKEDCISNIARDLTPSFGAKYSQENIDYEVKASRAARIKMARLKRFRKPYEVPWKNKILERCYNTPYLNPVSPPPSVITIGTPEKMLSRTADNVSNSNTSTPEKLHPSSAEGGTVPRSKSLDELDFAKLRLAETENHNFILEKKEIDNMSQHLQNLQVNE